MSIRVQYNIWRPTNGAKESSTQDPPEDIRERVSIFEKIKTLRGTRTNNSPGNGSWSWLWICFEGMKQILIFFAFKPIGPKHLRTDSCQRTGLSEMAELWSTIFLAPGSNLLSVYGMCYRVLHISAAEAHSKVQRFPGFHHHDTKDHSCK